MPEPGPGQPGNRSGLGPIVPIGGGFPPGTPPVGPRGVPSAFIPATAALAGAGAQGAALGSDLEKDRLARARPGAPDAEGRGPAKGAGPVAAVPDEEAKPARNAERYGAKPGRPAANSILQPATGSAPGEGDSEHVRKYGIDAGDLFEDERMTAPSLIGDEDERAD